MSSLACGAYYGILLQAKFFKGMTNYKQPQTKVALKILGRIAITVLIAAPVLALHLFKPTDNLAWMLIV